VTIGHEAKGALDELKNLLSHQVPTGDPAIIVEKALALLLTETKRKRAALVKRPRANARKRNDEGKHGSTDKSRDDKGGQRTRVIPSNVRRAVFERDGGRCAFIDDNGRKCGSAWQVELHHCVPFGRDGPHSVENIELRCRAHNQYEAELEFGKAFMEKRRQSA